MHSKKLGKMRFKSRPRQRNYRNRTHTARTKKLADVSPAAGSESTDFSKEEIISKLIPLNLPSAKDARKNAEKVLDNVFSAVRHVLSEGDLTISDFGRFKAAKGTQKREIVIAFTPDEKLKQAVEARVNPLP